MERRLRLVRVLVAASLPMLVLSSVEVMKDVTLGFGEALKHCREQVRLFDFFRLLELLRDYAEHLCELYLALINVLFLLCFEIPCI